MNKARQTLIAMAERDLGIRETLGANRGPGIERFWTATNYPGGYKDRAPYCCAAVCYWISEAAKKGVKWLAPLPKDAGCANFLAWARKREAVGHALVTKTPQPGDIVCFLPHFSHIGIVAEVDGEHVATIEANTVEANAARAHTDFSKERDGGGVYRRMRKMSLCGSFIRLLTPDEGAR
jgi:hypothetical protein